MLGNRQSAESKESWILHLVARSVIQGNRQAECVAGVWTQRVCSGTGLTWEDVQLTTLRLCCLSTSKLHIPYVETRSTSVLVLFFTDKNALCYIALHFGVSNEQHQTFRMSRRLKCLHF
jgi:hypothetical protein